MKKPFTVISVFLILLVSFSTIVQAQVPPAEPDTEAFIAATFQLQATYNNVLCVAQNGDCPAEITTAVPCLIASCQPADQTYPVSTSVATIQEGVSAAQPGDLIIIMPGRYRGVEAESIGGEEGAYIHLLGWGEPGTIIVDGSADPEKDYLRHHFYFLDVHHYIVQNLAFEGASEGAGLFFTGYFNTTGKFSHHIIVLDVYSHDNGAWGLHSTSTSDMLIQDSVFTNSAEEHGAYISGSGDNVVIRRNVFQGNIASGLQVNADPQTAGIELFYWLENSTGDTCGLSEEDTWHDIKACYDGQGLPDLGAFIEDGISENLIIEQNVITGNGESGGAGINLASLRNSVVRNNLIYGNFAAGIACWDNAYSEEKGLASSDFGCQNVRIVNNTLVDESGGRGSLIISRDARNLLVFNNIIIRDRFDAYEISFNSSEGLVSGYNYFSAQFIEESPAPEPEKNSITGFSVSEGLAQFVAPSFEPWVVDNGGWATLNPNRPDYHLQADSVLATSANAADSPTLDLEGNPRTRTEVGALGVGN